MVKNKRFNTDYDGALTLLVEMTHNLTAEQLVAMLNIAWPELKAELTEDGISTAIKITED